MESTLNLGNREASPESIWTNAPPKNITGIGDVTAQLEQEGQLEKPPAWFDGLVQKAEDLWFDPKSFESEEMYERLGIRTFKKYLPTGEPVSKLVWKLTRKKYFIKGSSEQDLRNYERTTRICEAVHLAILPIYSAAMGFSLAKGELGLAAFITGMNTLVNVYPILLQRYNRLRLCKSIERAQTRGTNRQQNNPAQNT